jgi:S1-C subfamily serine protease
MLEEVQMRAKSFLGLIGIGLAIVLSISVTSVMAQQTKTMTFEADDAFLIPGLMVLILPDDKGLKVEMVPPKDQLPKEYRNLDLHQGDLILMLNGKRTKTIDDLRDRYDSLAVADSVQFGIRRGQEMRIVSFVKPDEDIQGGGGRTMMVTKEIGDGPGAEEGVGTKVKMIGGGDGPEPILALDAGVIFTEKDGGVQVMVVIGNAEAELTGEPMKEGDRLVSIQGEMVGTGDEFRKQYNAIKIGTKVELVYSRDDVEHSVQFVKAKSENIMMQKSR